MPGDRSLQPRTYAILALLVIGAGLALRVPALSTGFTVDDYAQLSMMNGTYPVARAPLALFTFSNGSAGENRALRASGMFPWWSHPALRVSLFRPLSSALMWVDLYLFGDNAFAYHLHSAGWWLAMMTLWAAVLRRLLPGAWALLVLVLCVCHPAHGMLLGWIASRNAIVASSFALLGLLFQLRNAHRGLVFASYALALCASEYALGFVAYGACFEVERPSRGAPGLRRLAPALSLISIYALLRAGLGFGTRNSGTYIDPVFEPLLFLRSALWRLPVLAGDVVLAVRSDWWSSGFPWAAQFVRAWGLPEAWIADVRPLHALQIFLGVLALLLGGFVLWSRARSPAEASWPSLRFVALGLPLSFVPALSASPESRLLLPALFGWSLLLADHARTHASQWRVTAPRSARTLLALCLAAGLWLAEIWVPLSAARNESRDMARLSHAVRASILAPELDAMLRAEQRVLLLGAVDPTTTIYIPMLRRLYGRSAPDSCQLLTSAFSPHRLERLSDNSFALERLQTQYTALDTYASAFNAEPLRSGQRFVSPGLQVEVERALEGRAVRIRVSLDRSLDDDSVVLLAQTVSGLRRLAFPAPGAHAILAPPMPPVAFMESF